MVLSDRIAVMEGGCIRQVGPPTEVYCRPDDLFVAGFIGSPPINLLAPVEEAGHPLEGDPSRFVLGVRPPDVAVFTSPREQTLATEVLTVECTGSDTWVVVRYHEQRLKGRAAGDGILQAGAGAHLQIPRSRVFRFERDNGRRID